MHPNHLTYHSFLRSHPQSNWETPFMWHLQRGYKTLTNDQIGDSSFRNTSFVLGREIHENQHSANRSWMSQQESRSTKTSNLTGSTWNLVVVFNYNQTTVAIKAFLSFSFHTTTPHISFMRNVLFIYHQSQISTFSWYTLCYAWHLKEPHRDWTKEFSNSSLNWKQQWSFNHPIFLTKLLYKLLHSGQ